MCELGLSTLDRPESPCARVSMLETSLTSGHRKAIRIPCSTSTTGIVQGKPRDSFLAALGPVQKQRLANVKISGTINNLEGQVNVSDRH